MGRLSKLRRMRPAESGLKAGADPSPLSNCPNCGEDTSVLDSFCPKCGTMLAEEE